MSRLEDAIEGLARGSPKWLAILGPRKIGKTSLMLELARRHHRADLRFVVVDVMEDSPVTIEVFRRLALRVLDAVVDLPDDGSLVVLAREPSEYRAALTESKVFAALGAELRRFALDLPELELGKVAIRTCIDLAERLAHKTGVRVLLAIDEFQELAVLASKRSGFDPYPLLRSVWQTHRRVGYVVSGSGRSLLKSMITDERAPFFQHFSIMDLGPFSVDDARALLVELSPPERPIPTALAEEIVRVVGGHPFYLQLAGEALVTEPPPYDSRSLKAALQELLFSRSGRLALYFENVFEKIVGQSGHLAAVLEHVADGPFRLADIARKLALPTGTTLRYIERLGDAVRRLDDGRYVLDDPCLGLWLKWRRPGGTIVPMSLLGDEAERSAASHLARMGFELVYQSRASRGAFDLLGLYGGAHVGVQVKRSSMPLRFSKTEFARMTGDAKRFRWRWLIACVDEDGRVLLLDPAKVRRGKEITVGPAAVISSIASFLD